MSNLTLIRHGISKYNKLNIIYRMVRYKFGK